MCAAEIGFDARSLHTTSTENSFSLRSITSTDQDLITTVQGNMIYDHLSSVNLRGRVIKTQNLDSLLSMLQVIMPVKEATQINQLLQKKYGEIEQFEQLDQTNCSHVLRFETKDASQWVLKIEKDDAVRERQLIGELNGLSLVHENLVHTDSLFVLYDQKIHVVSAYEEGFSSSDKGEFIGCVTPYFQEAKSVAEELGEKLFAEDSAKQLMYGLLRALDSLHQNGVMHRDLKPGNILCKRIYGEDFDRIAEVKLLDFGESKRCAQSERAHTPCGTEKYNSPEKRNPPESGYTNASDIWGIGIILHEILTGKTPTFSNGVVNLSLVMKRDISFECQLFLTKLLKWSPENRISASDALNDNWFNNLKNQ